MKKNHMRNEEVLQNYSPSLMRIYLSGKEPCTNKVYMVGDKTSKQFWLQLFHQAIDDLNDGNFINGKGEKNEVAYWEKQITLLHEFVESN